MEYIKNNLLEQEKLIYLAQPHWIVFGPTVGSFLLAFLLYFLGPRFVFIPFFGYSLISLASLLLLLMALWQGVKAYIFFVTSEYGITDRRVIVKIGWIQRTSLEIMLEQVEGVYVDQTVIGRILNYGAITIIGTGGTNDRFPYIPDPLTFRRTAQQQIDFVMHPRDRT